MRVAVQKIEGVEDVTVSLNEGVAIVRFARANRVSATQVRQTIREKGFTPRDAHVRALGTIELRGDTLVLVIPGAGPAFTLRASAAMQAQLHEAIGRVIQLEGRIPEDDNGVPARVIEVSSIYDAGEPPLSLVGSRVLVPTAAPPPVSPAGCASRKASDPLACTPPGR